MTERTFTLEQVTTILLILQQNKLLKVKEDEINGLLNGVISILDQETKGL